jgi:hypothetical protein
VPRFGVPEPLTGLVVQASPVVQASVMRRAQS